MERTKASVQKEQNFNQTDREAIMALTRTKSGQFVIKSKPQAKAALKLMRELQDEISTLRAESGLGEL